MANVPISFGGGAGAGSSDCTGAKAQARAGYTFICSDTDDEPAAGLIQDYSGSTSFTPSTGSQTAYTGGKYAPNNITIGAIPSQHGDSGNITLTSGNAVKEYAAGWYNNAHGAQISAQSKSVTPSTSAQTINPDTGSVLSSVSVGAIPNQKAAATYTPSTSAQTIAANQWLLGVQTIAAIPNQTLGGTFVLTASNTSVSRSSGSYLTSALDVSIVPQSKSVTPSVSAQTISPDSGKVLSSVSVGAIPSQEYGGDVKLTASNTVSNFPASRWSLSRHYVYVDVFSW